MALPLKYNTASQVIIIGPFLDDADGKTAETGLSIANTDIKLVKHGGTSTTNKNSGGATHIASGYYYCTLDSTDTNTIGRLQVLVNMSGALPVWHECIVYPAEVYDYLFASAGTDYFKVDIAQINGTGVSTSSAQLGVNVVTFGGTTVTGRDIGASVLLSNGTGTGQISLSSGQVTVATNNDKTGYALSAAGVDAIWDEAQSGHTTAGTYGYYLDARVSQIPTSNPTAAAIADAVWDEPRADHTSSGTFGQGVASVQGNVTGSVASVSGAVGSVTGNVGGNVVGSVGSISGVSFPTNFGSLAITSLGKVTVGTNDDKTGYYLANNAVDSAQFTQAAADKVWSSTTRSITDKSGFSLSSSGIDAIWDATGSLSISFETLVQRAYQILSNKMTVNESSGNLVLRNIGDTANIASGNVSSSSGTTTRTELSWV